MFKKSCFAKSLISASLLCSPIIGLAQDVSIEDSDILAVNPLNYGVYYSKPYYYAPYHYYYSPRPYFYHQYYYPYRPYHYYYGWGS